MGLIAGPVAQPIVRPVVGGWRTLSRRFADIIKGRTAIVYDHQDLTTLFQDAQGTLPVYRPGSGAVDPPVGLLLDKSMGLELGPELWTGALFVNNSSSGANGVYNAATGELSNTVVGTIGFFPSFTNASLGIKLKKFYRVKLKFSGNLAPLFSVTLDNTAASSNFDTGGVSGNDIRSAGGEIEYIGVNSITSPGIRISTDGRTTWNGLFIESISIREIKGYHAYQTTTTARPTLSGRYNLLTATETLSTQSVTTAATDYTLRFEGTGTATLSGKATGTYSAGTHTITCTAGTLTLTVAGSVTKADLRVSNDGVGLPPYQRVDSATTYDTNGFPLYLRFDGVDDFLQTANVDLTGTNAFVMGIGTRKLSDAAAGGIIESSVNFAVNSGSFVLLAPANTGTNNFNFAARTTSVAGLATSNPPYKSPNTQNVICKAGGGSIVLKVGATDMRTTSLPPGNFGSYPLYIGSRAGKNAYFNGRIYSLCIIGSLLSTAEQSILERYLNAKTRAY